jgi:hypothetical protein
MPLEIVSHLMLSRKTVCLPEAGVPVSTARSTAHLETLGSDGAAERLKRARRGVQVCEQVATRLDLLGPGTSRTGGFLLVGTLHHLAVLLVLVHHRLSSKVQSKGRSQQWKQTNLDHGVVQHWCLRLASRSITILELAANSAVTRGDGNTTSKNGTSLHYDSGTHPRERAVHERWRSTTRKLVGLGIHVLELCQHADMRHLNLVEEQKSIVHGVVTELGADIPDVNILQRLVGLEIANLHAERCWAVRLAVDYELSHDNRVVGSTAERTNPPLACREMGRVNGESLVVGVPRSRRLQAANVGAMAELGLGVASDDLVVVGEGEPFLLLLRCGLSFKCDLRS